MKQNIILILFASLSSMNEHEVHFISSCCVKPPDVHCENNVFFEETISLDADTQFVLVSSSFHPILIDIAFRQWEYSSLCSKQPWIKVIAYISLTLKILNVAVCSPFSTYVNGQIKYDVRSFMMIDIYNFAISRSEEQSRDLK